ncbi:hypothetical protein [Variovorax sp. HJSM1_2]|uniref:hypothetical protein n=1 Tax=Variovorax sp. HJSM1_2 TaxID=3366263 RepID=UPI003BBBC676
MSANDGMYLAGAVPANAVLAMLDVYDRSGALLQSQPVRHWPVTVGRALTADLVLSDVHVAAEHLRIDTPAAPGDAAGAGDEAPLVVYVLETLNGVRHGHQQHARGSRFAWSGADDLVLGRLRLRLRLADAALAPEQLLARFRWRSLALTAMLLLAYMAQAVWGTWLDNAELSRFGVSAAKMLAVLLGFALVWAGAAALVSKLFAGHAHFWRHVRIVLGVSVASTLLSGLMSAAAFAFSWVLLARLAPLVDWWALALGLLLQWWVIVPPRRQWLQRSVIVGLLLVGAAVTAWFIGKDNQGEPYLARLYPPGWRVVAPVPVPQWLAESQLLRERLDKRLQSSEEDEGTDPADAEEDEEE